MSLTAEQLYELLPAIYRIRDAGQGEPLKALVAVIAEQAAVMEADIAQLYENWFIETCDEWVVPYIGAGLGVRGLHSLEDAPFSQRAFVANTFAYRRRKGTPAVLEQLARDTTGWNARAVEFFELLETTQHYNHIRLHNVRTPDLRDTNQLELIDTAFDKAAHTGDVRRIAIGRGRHNIPNIGLFIWRLQSYFLPRAGAKSLTSPTDGRYTFSPLGMDSSLFNRPQAETDITHVTEEIDVPGLLRRRPLYDELEARRQAIADELGAATLMQPSLYDALARFHQAVIDETSSLAPFMIAVQQAGGSQTLLNELADLLDDTPLPRAALAEVLRVAILGEYHGETLYFGSQPVLQVFVQYQSGAPFYETLPEEIQICTLKEPPVAVPEGWLRPEPAKTYQSAAGTPQALPIKVAVDPVLGRLAFPAGVSPNAMKVSYAYGFSGDVGGGPYNRRESVLSILKQTPDFQRGVSQEIAPVQDTIVATLGEAISDWNVWNSQNSNSFGVIAIMDSNTYEEDLTGPNRIKISKGSQLLIIAADWPEVPVLGGLPGEKERVSGQIGPDDRRPHILGNIAVEGTPASLSEIPGELVLNGLLIDGGLIVDSGNDNLGSLLVSHCTLVPGKGGLTVTPRNEELKITLLRSICGAIDLVNPVLSLRVEESIVDAVAIGAKAISAAGTKVEIEKSTMFGLVSALELEAGNSIFTDVVTAARRQGGCVRFSYVPDGSKTPRRFRCQPDLAADDLPAAAQAVIRARMVPSFTSEHYGHYAYAQLSQSCAVEVTTGAEDGSEMGVFCFLKQPQRVTNLQTALDEYLRFGMEAGIIFVT